MNKILNYRRYENGPYHDYQYLVYHGYVPLKKKAKVIPFKFEYKPIQTTKPEKK